MSTFTKEKPKIIKTHISIVIPVFEAECFLMELYSRLITTLESITQDYEIIMIDDGSDDNSWDIIVKLAQSDCRVRGFKFSRNFGQHYALTAGIDHSCGDWVVTMDCDLQDQPEDILRLYQKAQQGYDVVLAKRTNSAESIIKRTLSCSFYKIFSYFLDYDYKGGVGNFRLMSKKVVYNCNKMRQSLRFFGAHVDWMGFSTTHVDVRQSRRLKGKSSYSFKKKCKLACEAIIAYSDKPLRLSVSLGLCMAFLALLFGLYTHLISTNNDASLTSTSDVIVSIYFVGGLIISNLGIVGIYLGKTFKETQKRPLYIIDKSTYDYE